MRNCIQGSLKEFTPSPQNPWDRRRVQHLYNRIGNGASLADINYALTKTPDQIIDELIDEAVAMPPPDTETFPWAYSPNFESPQPFPSRHLRAQMLNKDWIKGLINTPVKHKLILFWHSNLAIEIEINDSPIATFIYLYYRTLSEFAFGDFKEFIKRIGLTPQMLRYLNGQNSSKEQANENFARELLELFTLGVGNYSQTDIEEIARALTGWRTGNGINDLNKGEFLIYPEDKLLNANAHDWTSVSLFGQIYNPPSQPADQTEAVEEAYKEYEWVIDTIFGQKPEIVAKHICRKLYQFYVYHEADEDIVAGLAQTFIDEEFKIAPVLRQLFKSEHFFNENAIGGHIKSPLGLLASYYKMSGLIYNTHWFPSAHAFHPDYDPDHPFAFTQDPGTNTNREHVSDIHGNSIRMGQRILSPPSVAGWAAGRSWMNESTIVERWRWLTLHIHSTSRASPVTDLVDEYHRQFMKDVSGTSNDPRVVAEAIIDHFMIVRPNAILIENAVQAFKSSVPSNYFDDGLWNLDFNAAPTQFRDLLKYLVRLPEWQLA